MLKKIASFTINHDTLTPGMYVSRIDGDCVHSSTASEQVVYFGPMGCRTGFYLILRDSMSKADALQLVRDAFRFAADFEGEIPGAKKIECGNYLEHDLTGAKQEAAAYCGVLSRCSEAAMVYPD